MYDLKWLNAQTNPKPVIPWLILTYIITMSLFLGIMVIIDQANDSGGKYIVSRDYQTLAKYAILTYDGQNILKLDNAITFFRDGKKYDPTQVVLTFYVDGMPSIKLEGKVTVEDFMDAAHDQKIVSIYYPEYHMTYSINIDGMANMWKNLL